MSNSPFTIEHHQAKRCDIFTPHGRIDSSTAPQLEEALKSVIEAGRYNIVVNLSDVSFLSSAALRVLVSAAQQCRKLGRGGDVYLAEVPEQLKEVFDLTGLDHLFKFFETDAEAAGSF
ncbi:MAG TPA: anti-sigma factor antagonist [Anaerolineae bacterium]|nr:anti-sigma factor antagonist [Anaerolineae bacterium]